MIIIKNQQEWCRWIETLGQLIKKPIQQFLESKRLVALTHLQKP